jgi:probable F420-dependent oxidoreductase
MLKVDSGIPVNMKDVKERAEWLEAIGYDGGMTAETSHDPFLPLAIAAEHTSKIDLMTSIAVAFARNPMLLANLGHDLNAYSEGRFILGLGSQIRPHIRKRFSMEWSHPAARMKEMILAIHAIWDNWHDGAPLDFRGEFYEHSLMTPVFTPVNTEHGRPRVFLAAVGPKMTQTAAEVADGLIVHSFSTAKYIQEVTMPIVEETLKATGRKREDFELSYPAFVVTGETEEQFNKAKKMTRERIAFYGSTPAYKVVLEAHGWNDLQPELNRMSKAGQWEEMGTLIEDDILNAFATVGEPKDIVNELKSRYDGVLDRLTIGFEGLEAETVAGLISEFKAA